MTDLPRVLAQLVMRAPMGQTERRGAQRRHERGEECDEKTDRLSRHRTEK